MQSCCSADYFTSQNQGFNKMKTRPQGYARIKMLHGYLERALFHRKHGISYDKMLRAVELLAKLVHDYEAASEDIWSIGECGNADMVNMLSGSYWFFVQNYDGQWSDEYRIQCTIGQVFSPGPCCKGPEKDSCEMDTYKAWKRRAKSARR